MRICIPDGYSIDDLLSSQAMDALVEEYLDVFFQRGLSKKEFLDKKEVNLINREYFYCYFGM